MNYELISSRSSLRIHGAEIVPSLISQDWRELVAYFVTRQDVRESSRNTYKRSLTRFFTWTEKNRKTLSGLTRTDILEYKDSLFACGFSPLTISSYITAVSKFFEFAEAERVFPNIAKGVKRPKRKQAFKKQHLADDKCVSLLSYYSERSLRDYAIVSTLLRTGLRTIEITRLNIEDITFRGDRRILKVWGKGRDERDDFVVLTDKAFEPIKAYLDACRKGAKGGEPLFVSNSRQNRGERLTTRTISGICKEGLKAVGLDGREFTAHSLRHTTAVSILTHGGTIADAQSVLRHASPITTQIYTESIKEELRLKEAPESLLDTAF